MILICRCSLSISFSSCRLDGGDVGADRDVAAVLGAAFADVQPAAVLELRLEGTRARRLAFARDLGTDNGLAPGADDVLVRGPRHQRLVRQIMQLLEVGVAQHQAVVGVPQHEGFRDGLDGVAQPQIRFRSPFDQRLLLRDVDRDADQVRPAFARLARPARSVPAARPSCHWRDACGKHGRWTRSGLRQAGRRAGRGAGPPDGPAR